LRGAKVEIRQEKEMKDQMLPRKKKKKDQMLVTTRERSWKRLSLQVSHFGHGFLPNTHARALFPAADLLSR